MSSEVQAKWTNSLARASSGTPAKRSFSQYSIALTSWLVVSSIALTRSASATVNAARASASSARVAAENGATSATAGSSASACSHASSTCTRYRIRPYSLKYGAREATLRRYRPSRGLRAVSTASETGASAFGMMVRAGRGQFSTGTLARSAARRGVALKARTPRRWAGDAAFAGPVKSPAADSRLQNLLELVQDRGIFQGRHVLRDRFALGDRTQQPAHDLARARLGQVVAETDVLRLGDRADLLADPVAQLLGDLVRIRAVRPRLLQYDEGADRFTGEIVGTADHRGFGNERVGHERRLDLHGPQPVAGDVEHVVDAAHDGEVSGLLVPDRAVAGQIERAAELLRVIRLAVALRVTPDG